MSSGGRSFEFAGGMGVYLLYRMSWSNIIDLAPLQQDKVNEALCRVFPDYVSHGRHQQVVIALALLHQKFHSSML